MSTSTTSTLSKNQQQQLDILNKIQTQPQFKPQPQPQTQLETLLFEQTQQQAKFMELLAKKFSSDDEPKKPKNSKKSKKTKKSKKSKRSSSSPPSSRSSSSTIVNTAAFEALKDDSKNLINLKSKINRYKNFTSNNIYKNKTVNKVTQHDDDCDGDQNVCGLCLELLNLSKSECYRAFTFEFAGKGGSARANLHIVLNNNAEDGEFFDTNEYVLIANGKTIRHALSNDCAYVELNKSRFDKDDSKNMLITFIHDYIVQYYHYMGINNDLGNSELFQKIYEYLGNKKLVKRGGSDGIITEDEFDNYKSNYTTFFNIAKLTELSLKLAKLFNNTVTAAVVVESSESEAESEEESFASFDEVIPPEPELTPESSEQEEEESEEEEEVVKTPTRKRPASKNAKKSVAKRPKAKGKGKGRGRPATKK